MLEQGSNSEGVAGSVTTHRRPAYSEASTTGWVRAGLIGAGVLIYFVVATAWLPSTLLRFDSVASSSPWVRDAIATVCWLATLVTGMFGLRWAQAREWI